MPFYLGWGFALWAIATVVLRVAGQHFFDPDNRALMVASFIAVVPLIALTTYPVYRWRHTPLPDRPLAALSMMLPGMLLDVVGVAFFNSIFSNLQEDAGVYFGAWLLWAYSLVLISAILPEPAARRL